jgi:ribonuclease T1
MAVEFDRQPSGSLERTITMLDNVDIEIEQKALREHGILGRGRDMGNVLYAMDYALLPPEAQHTIQLIINGGPFPHPEHDGNIYGNWFGDLPSSREYLEFTVPTPGLRNRGKRRIVARTNGILFFTACHYERVQGRMAQEERRALTEQIDERWRNGFYVVTGMSRVLRQQVAAGIELIRSRRLPVVVQAAGTLSAG